MKKAQKSARRRRRPAHVKVFISHATSDKKRATRLRRLLAKHRINYWYSREHVIDGQSWYRNIGSALGTCNWLIVVASRAAVRNRWVREEVTYTLLERRYRNHVIPLMFEECNLRLLAWSLASIQYIDFRDGWQQGSDRLLKRLGKLKSR